MATEPGLRVRRLFPVKGTKDPMPGAVKGVCVCCAQVRDFSMPFCVPGLACQGIGLSGLTNSHPLMLFFSTSTWSRVGGFTPQRLGFGSRGALLREEGLSRGEPF